MKKLLLLVAVVVALPSFARAGDSAADQFAQFLSDKVKEGRAVVRMSPFYKPAYGAYVPVWTLAAKDSSTGKPSKDPLRRYFSVGGGGKIDMETKAASGFLGCDLNLVALSARAWDWDWAREHLDRASFPPIYAGPSFDVPTSYEGLKSMSLRRDLRAQFGISYPITALQTSSPKTP